MRNLIIPVYRSAKRENVPLAFPNREPDVVAFYDKYRDAPIHILVVPKYQYVSYDDFILKASAKIVGFFKAVREITYKYNLEGTGYGKIEVSKGIEIIQNSYYLAAATIDSLNASSLENTYLQNPIIDIYGLLLRRPPECITASEYCECNSDGAAFYVLQFDHCNVTVNVAVC
ncbi:putative 13HIT-like protein in hisE 3'region [Dirofilaria immitis]